MSGNQQEPPSGKDIPQEHQIGPRKPSIFPLNKDTKLFKGLFGSSTPSNVMDDYVEYLDILDWKPNLILYGPPGTGKTYHAKKIADELGSELHAKAERISQADVLFTDAMNHLALLFREGAAIVGVVTSVSRSQVEDEEFTCLGIAISRRSTALIALVIISECRERFASHFDGCGVQLVKDFQFIDSGGDDFASPLVHGMGAGNGPLDHGQFVGILNSPHLAELRFHVDQLLKGNL